MKAKGGKALNRFTIGDLVTLDGKRSRYEIVEVRYVPEDGVCTYGLHEAEGDGETLDVPEFRLAAAGAKRKKYRYAVSVEETCLYRTAVESDREMTYGEVEGEAERRRVRGDLSLCGVTDVRTVVEKAFVDGRERAGRVFADG